MKESLYTKDIFVLICPGENIYIEHLSSLVLPCLFSGLNKWPGLETINSIDQELICLKHIETLILIPQTP